MKLEDLKRLQEIQFAYIGRLDMQIETRNDKQQTTLYMTDFPVSKKLNLYIHKLHWLHDNTKEFEMIESEINNIINKYDSIK